MQLSEKVILLINIKSQSKFFLRSNQPILDEIKNFLNVEDEENILPRLKEGLSSKANPGNKEEVVTK